VDLDADALLRELDQLHDPQEIDDSLLEERSVVRMWEALATEQQVARDVVADSGFDGIDAHGGDGLS